MAHAPLLAGVDECGGWHCALRSVRALHSGLVHAAGAGRGPSLLDSAGVVPEPIGKGPRVCQHPWCCPKSHSHAGFRANVWVAVQMYVGNHFVTHFFYNVLGMRYTVPVGPWVINRVPIVMFLMTHPVLVPFVAHRSTSARTTFSPRYCCAAWACWLRMWCVLDSLHSALFFLHLVPLFPLPPKRPDTDFPHPHVGDCGHGSCHRVPRDVVHRCLPPLRMLFPSFPSCMCFLPLADTCMRHHDIPCDARPIRTSTSCTLSAAPSTRSSLSSRTPCSPPSTPRPRGPCPPPPSTPSPPPCWCVRPAPLMAGAS